jgi:hypothetical protein
MSTLQRKIGRREAISDLIVLDEVPETPHGQAPNGLSVSTFSSLLVIGMRCILNRRFALAGNPWYAPPQSNQPNA